MSNLHNPMPASLRRVLTTLQAEKKPVPVLRKPGTLSTVIFDAPDGFKYAGKIVVENWMEVENTVPEDIYQMAGLSDKVIIKLRSETIVENGRMVKDRITAEFFEWDISQFRCV